MGMFWACVGSAYMNKFESKMEALRKYDEKAHKWLLDNTSPRHWSRSHFGSSSKCDILLNNLCESFNTVILDAREKPLSICLKTLEDIPYGKIKDKEGMDEKKE